MNLFLDEAIDVAAATNPTQRFTENSKNYPLRIGAEVVNHAIPSAGKVFEGIGSDNPGKFLDGLIGAGITALIKVPVDVALMNPTKFSTTTPLFGSGPEQTEMSRKSVSVEGFGFNADVRQISKPHITETLSTVGVHGSFGRSLDLSAGIGKSEVTHQNGSCQRYVLAASGRVSDRASTASLPISGLPSKVTDINRYRENIPVVREVFTTSDPEALTTQSLNASSPQHFRDENVFCTTKDLITSQNTKTLREVGFGSTGHGTESRMEGQYARDSIFRAGDTETTRCETGNFDMKLYETVHQTANAPLIKLTGMIEVSRNDYHDPFEDRKEIGKFREISTHNGQITIHRGAVERVYKDGKIIKQTDTIDQKNIIDDPKDLDHHIQIVHQDTNEPNVKDPNANEPNVKEPNVNGVSDPNINKAHVNNVIEPNVIEPNVIEPNVIEPNVIEPNVIEPNVIEPNVIEPNVIEPNVIEPPVIEPPVIEQIVLPSGGQSAAPLLSVEDFRKMLDRNPLMCW